MVPIENKFYIKKFFIIANFQELKICASHYR